MPPFVSRKRHRSPSPEKTAQPKSRNVAASGSKRRKTQDPAAPTVEDNKAFLDNTAQSSDDSSLSDPSSEDVAGTSSANVQRGSRRSRPAQSRSSGNGSSEEESSDSDDAKDEDDAWDEFLATHEAQQNTEATAGEGLPETMELTLDKAPELSRSEMNAGDKKKGPTKIERQIRTSAHCLHVQSLLVHNLIRNGWTCSKKVQDILRGDLPDGCKDEIEQWRQSVGTAFNNVSEYRQLAKHTKKPDAKKTKKAQAGKAKGHAQSNQRNWGHKAEEINPEISNAGYGDPTLRLLKALSAFWRKRFNITAPGCRKQGYKDLGRLRDEVRSFNKGDFDPQEHGERIASFEDFFKAAKTASGSRDVGAQLFVALLRSVGLSVRLVASLQPIGFGWSKSEEAHPPKQNEKQTAKSQKVAEQAANGKKSTKKEASSKTVSHIDDQNRNPPTKTATPAKRKTRNSGASKDDAINIDLSDSTSPLSSPPDSEASDLDDDNSVIDVTPSKPIASSKRFDRDLPAPIYWAEVLSPISNTYIPVDPIVLSMISNNPGTHQYFEPRGAKAERAKQVMAYVIAYSSDGTAKDVTVRYLKQRMWPGKTKSVRMPVEKIPVYNRKGKIKHHENYDWFKTVISVFARSSERHTEADEIEDANELVPVRHTRVDKPAEPQKETLTWYKTSSEFVLQCHLRREEAPLPHAEPVKHFTFGKGDKTRTEPVYLRKDIVDCKTPESWHKEGRTVKAGQQPLKFVPMRAVTLTRKREIEEAERETGEKVQQAMYSRAQTEWIIPPPIKDGKIPRNSFGNIDIYVPTMIPKGAVHIPLTGTAKVCKNLEIDFAEACTGFEFGNKRAVPIITGVVIAKEHEDRVIDAWEALQEEKRQKEELKRKRLALGMWKKFVGGLRVLEKVRKEYGGGEEAGRRFDATIKKRTAATDRTDSFYANAETEEDNSYLSEQPDISARLSGNESTNHPGSLLVQPGGFLRPGEEAIGKDENNIGTTNGNTLVLDDQSQKDKGIARSREVTNSHGGPVSLKALRKAEAGTENRAGDHDLSDNNTGSPEEAMEASYSSEHKPAEPKMSAKKTAKVTSRQPKTAKTDHRIVNGSDTGGTTDELAERTFGSSSSSDDQDKSETPQTVKSRAGRITRAKKTVGAVSDDQKRRSTRLSQGRVRSRYFEASESESDDGLEV